MTDRGSVIEALEQAIPFMRVKGYGAVALIMLDALELLEEQEPVKPVDRWWDHGRYYACGSCGEPLGSVLPSYCPHCGKKVMRDG